MRSLLLASVPLALLSTAMALEPKGEATGGLDGVNLGEHWFGPNLTLDDLKGRIVLLEFWGYN